MCATIPLLLLTTLHIIIIHQVKNLSNTNEDSAVPINHESLKKSSYSVNLEDANNDANNNYDPPSNFVMSNFQIPTTSLCIIMMNHQSAIQKMLVKSLT